MKAKIYFDDGVEYNLPDVSYDIFTDYVDFEGSSDIEYDKYLKAKLMKDIFDFNDSVLKSEIHFEDEDGRVIKYRCIEDSNKKLPQTKKMILTVILNQHDGNKLYRFRIEGTGQVLEYVQPCEADTFDGMEIGQVVALIGYTEDQIK